MSRQNNSHHKIHQRKPSLTTACPPTSSKQARKTSSPSFSIHWCQHLWTSRLVRSAVYVYVLFSMLFCAFHFLTFSEPEQSLSLEVPAPAPVPVSQASIVEDKIVHSPPFPSPGLNSLNTQFRLSKMFSKSLPAPDNVRPFWFTSSSRHTYFDHHGFDDR
ncbi:unnamed protein product [Absidia cylindrospora]